MVHQSIRCCLLAGSRHVHLCLTLYLQSFSSRRTPSPTRTISSPEHLEALASRRLRSSGSWPHQHFPAYRSTRGDLSAPSAKSRAAQRKQQAIKPQSNRWPRRPLGTATSWLMVFELQLSLPKHHHLLSPEMPCPSAVPESHLSKDLAPTTSPSNTTAWTTARPLSSSSPAQLAAPLQAGTRVQFQQVIYYKLGFTLLHPLLLGDQSLNTLLYSQQEKRAMIILNVFINSSDYSINLSKSSID